MSETEKLDMRDWATFSSCPCVPVPRFSPLTPMGHGQRLLIAGNGLFLQAKRAFLECTHLLQRWPVGTRLAFGDVEEQLTLAFGRIPLALLANFVQQGREALPNEIAGGIVFDTKSGATHLVRFEAASSSAGHIDYRLPSLPSSQVVAVDLHTHGALPSFFSIKDDRDDRAEVKISGVFGNLDRERPTACFRLCLNGPCSLFKPLPIPGQLADAPSHDSGRLEEEALWPTLIDMGFEFA